MFYPLLKIYARLVFPILFHRIRINKPEALQRKGPLLLACNHPNSFLDGIILTTLFEAPVYSLARGDAFKQPWANRLLRRLRLLPVYRTSEGVENLEHNYTTFASCLEVFKENGVVLIFSEGRCINEWHLRPLKKGTARLATSAWQQGIPLQVVPVALNYSSFRKFGKEVHIGFGTPIDVEAVLQQEGEGRQWLQFNGQLNNSLEKMVYEIPAGNQQLRRRIFNIGWKPEHFALLLPALLGGLLHLPLFLLIKGITHYLFPRNDHYDSIMAALMLIAYPFYYVTVTVLAGMQGGLLASLVALVGLPLTALAAMRIKYALDL